MNHILLKPSNCKNCNYIFWSINCKFRGFCSGECYYSYYSNILFSESSVLTNKNNSKEYENKKKYSFSL